MWEWLQFLIRMLWSGPTCTLYQNTISKYIVNISGTLLEKNKNIHTGVNIDILLWSTAATLVRGFSLTEIGRTHRWRTVRLRLFDGILLHYLPHKPNTQSVCFLLFGFVQRFNQQFFAQRKGFISVRLIQWAWFTCVRFLRCWCWSLQMCQTW